MSSFFALFVAIFIIIVVQAANFVSLFHASKAVLFASQNDYELTTKINDGGGDDGAESFLGVMMNNNKDKDSNHNQKLPCYKIKTKPSSSSPSTTTTTIPETQQISNDEDAKSDHNNKDINHRHATSSFAKIPSDIPNLVGRDPERESKTAVVVLTYNRPNFLERTIKSIQRAHLSDKLNGHKYISIDGDDRETKVVAKRLAHATSGINVMQHHHSAPPGDLTATYSLAAHYHWVFDQLFTAGEKKYENLIIFEDDMDVGFDIFTFFDTFEPVLSNDPSVWCISSWNDNAFDPPFELSYQKVFRSSYFPGLGWMLKRSLWVDDLSKKWPKDNWDHWMRVSTTHKQRSCIVPFISRNFNFGDQGSTANEEFYKKFLGRVKSTGSTQEITTWGNAQRKEMEEKVFVKKAQNAPFGLNEVMGMSTLSYYFGTSGEESTTRTSSNPKVIEKEFEYDEWLQKQIASAEIIRDITKIHSMIDNDHNINRMNKPILFPYVTESFEDSFSKIFQIHSFPRTHYKFVSWFVLKNGRNLFLVNQRLSPFIPDLLKISPDDSLEPVVAPGTGVSCTSTCAGHRSVDGSPGIVFRCDETQFDFINSCDVLSDYFPDCACQQGWGEDIPNMEASSIHHPPPANCLVTEMKPTCDASHALTTRLCPCVKA